MCGIAGIVAPGADVGTLRPALQAMTDAIAHRGPDGEGHWSANGIALGHRRLAIIDLSGGYQPMCSEGDKFALTFNGEIYNYKALRNELEQLGARFKTQSDTEVVLQGWIHWGPALVERIHGIFAFAIWEADARKLWLVRDRLGIKPLYVGFAGTGAVHFASELKGILASPFVSAKQPRLDAVIDYFTLGYVPPKKSILEGFDPVGPGELWCIDGETLVCTRRTYWTPPISDDQLDPIDAETTWELLQAAVTKQVVSDVPIAAFLSGGVDSSAVVAAMAGQDLDGLSVYSIAVGEGDFDESPYAAAVARRYGLNHRIRRVDIDDGLDVEAIARTYDEPFADSSSIPTLRLCEFTASGHKVALSGDGGDETFLGYTWYCGQASRDSLRRRLTPTLTRAAASAAAPVFGLAASLGRPMRGRGYVQALRSDPIEGLLLTQSLAPFVDIRSILSPFVNRQTAQYATADYYREIAAETAAKSALAQAQYLDFKMYLPGDILTKVDRASMRYSLEVRVPFLDEDLLAKILALPRASVMPEGRRKGLLIDAVRDRLPRNITDRRKQGFSVPLDEWFRGRLASILRRELEGQSAGTHMLDMRRVAGVLDQHETRRADNGPLLWAILMFIVSIRQLI